MQTLLIVGSFVTGAVIRGENDMRERVKDDGYRSLDRTREQLEAKERREREREARRLAMSKGAASPTAAAAHKTNDITTVVEKQE